MRLIAKADVEQTSKRLGHPDNGHPGSPGLG